MSFFCDPPRWRNSTGPAITSRHIGTGISPAPFPAARDCSASVAPRGWRHDGGRRVRGDGKEGELRCGAGGQSRRVGSEKRAAAAAAGTVSRWLAGRETPLSGGGGIACAARLGWGGALLRQRWRDVVAPAGAGRQQGRGRGAAIAFEVRDGGSGA